MSSFIKADVRQTNEYGASFSHFLFDTLSKLADRSTEQVKSGQGCNLHICGIWYSFDLIKWTECTVKVKNVQNTSRHIH